MATNAAFIPTPGSVSAVGDYDQLYPPNKWRDPITYIHSTQSVEEACTNALADHEYTYYMDEIDKQWLDKNNSEARGEGTSTHGACSTARSPRKGKNKEPEIGVPVSITEDEFELVMGLLEKLNDQKVVPTHLAIMCSSFPAFRTYRVMQNSAATTSCNLCLTISLRHTPLRHGYLPQLFLFVSREPSSLIGNTGVPLSKAAGYGQHSTYAFHLSASLPAAQHIPSSSTKAISSTSHMSVFADVTTSPSEKRVPVRS